jgi:hypothetical protein
LFLYLQRITTDSKSIARRTFGGDGGYANHKYTRRLRPS